MKITLKGKIGTITKDGSGTTTIALKIRGKVAKGNPYATEALMDGTLHLKDVIADQLKIGEELTVLVSSSDEQDEQCQDT